MASSEVYKVVLSGGAPWGFRLQGGKEFRAPLRIAKVTPGSKAQQANIYEGLYVQAINNHQSVGLTHGEALNVIKKSGNELELVLCWKPDSSSLPQPSTGSYTTEDINRGTHVTRATFKPSSEGPSYATLPRGQVWRGDVDENFNSKYVPEVDSTSEWDPNIISNVTRPPEPIKLLTTTESIRSATSTNTESLPRSEVHVQRGFDKPQPIGRGGRRFDEPSHDQSYGYKPPLTSGSIGSDEDFNMANGESSSQDSGPHYASINRPAMNQFRKQKVNAEIEATRDPKPLPKKVPPPPPAKPERRYPNIMEQEKYKGPSRPAIKRGGKWYKEMFKEMHATAGASSNLSALLANDAAKAGEEEQGEDGEHPARPHPPSDFIHPMQARPVESQVVASENEPNYYSQPVQERKYTPPARTQPVSPPGGTHEAHVPTWYQDMLKGERIPTEEPLSYGVHRKHPSHDSGNEPKQRFTGPHAPVLANRPPDYVAPLSRSAADRPMHRTVPTTVTVQQEERSKPPTATSLYESRFRGGQAPASVRSASEELGVKQQPPSDEDLIRKREEEARLKREEEERRRQEEEREMLRQQQKERQRREREAEMKRRKQEAQEAARKAAERPQFFAMALYNFDAQNPKELSFKKGEYIIVKRQIDRNWIEGELKGRIGIFPTNYVELRPIDDEEEEAQPESPPSPYVPIEGEAQVKYNFKADTAREISVGKGDIVTLTRRVDQNWYEGISQGRKGIMPAAYLEVLREPGLVPKAKLSPKAVEQPRRQEPVRHEETIRKEETPQVSHMPQQFTEIRKTTTTTTYDQREDQPRSYGEPIRVTSQSGQPQSKGGYSKPQPQVKYISKEPEPAVLPAQVVMDEHEMFPMEGERFRAAYSYRPQNDDELSLEEGEEVIVLEKCDDGWFVGHSTRTGLFGTFPGNYVVPL